MWGWRPRLGKPHRVGWITYDSFLPPKRSFDELISFTRMRVGNVARWIERASPLLGCELWRPDRRYDVVVFHKMMDRRCQEEARRIQEWGGKVVFDANVNYYEIWGEYTISGTRPTDQQQQDALEMTRLADWVVVDSTYIGSIACRVNPRVSWIPDNVDTRVYRGQRRHRNRSPVVLVVSTVAKKAQHLLEIREALTSLGGKAELLLVSDERPEALDALSEALPCRYQAFSDRTYSRALLSCDIIISPKRLANSYEMGHTEYKITLGMAVGLPAVASPQPSYIEAIGRGGGGIIASSLDEWRETLARLTRDPALRADLGARARQTVLRWYSTPVVAGQYRTLLERLAQGMEGA